MSRATATRARACAALLLVAACATTPPGRVLPSPSAAPVAPPAPTARARWRPVPVRATAPSLPERAITALPGDTPRTIAARTGAAPGALVAANRTALDAVLAPGRSVRLPAGATHTVARGETLSAIARAYRAPLARVAAANGLSAPYPLEIGDRVLIPPPSAPRASKPPEPATIEARAATYGLDIDALLRGEPGKPVVRPPARDRPTPATAAPTPRRPRATAGPTSPPEAASRPQAARPAPAPVTIADAPRLDWPLRGRILSGFGAKPGGRFNDGVNIAAVAGAEVRAAAEGTVAYAGDGVAAFGGLVIVRHAGGWLTAYAHLDAILVARGDTLTRGQPLGRAGATGEVDAPQLHFEVRRGRAPVDPLPLIGR